MGCSSSTPSVKSVSDSGVSGAIISTTVGSYTKIINEKCSRIRLDHCKDIKTLYLDGENYKYSVRYVYVSQRGYYPQSLNKPNQDSYLICENMCGDENCHLFGVFDGHGEYGDYVSHYAADHTPQNLEKEMRKCGGVSSFEKETMEKMYSKAFTTTNKALHKSSGIDDSLSGTTAITVVVSGDVVYVANVGDSRAIIGSSTQDGIVKFSPLSSDQTPFRKDERERLKKKGAIIMTLDQIEGTEPQHENWGAETGENIDESGDPPRVWDQTLERPGCAFTRSIGDNVAEQVGVFAEPEILTWKIAANDKYIVIASDGVFEFLTSQAVIDMIEQNKGSEKGLLDAAKKIVSESYNLWLTYDDRTDDITIIILELSNICLKDGSRAPAKDFNKVDGPMEVKVCDPYCYSIQSEFFIIFSIYNIVLQAVRRVMSKTKRAVISENWKEDGGKNDKFDFEKNASVKSPEELERISAMVASNFLFQHLSPAQKGKVFMVMKLKIVTTGDTIIKEGDIGDEMYIIDNGEFSVHKRDENGINQTVFTYTSPGATFGELSLMYGKPRAATVRAKTDGALWSISRQAFRAVMMKQKEEGLMKKIMAVPVFSNIVVSKLQRLTDLTTIDTYEDGDEIAVDSKEPFWSLCIILAGSVSMTTKKDASKSKNRKDGSFIVANEIGRDFANVIAIGKVKVGCIPKSAFVEIMGSGALDELIHIKPSKDTKMQRQGSIWSVPESNSLSGKASIQDYTLDNVCVQIGDFGYVGVFKHQTLGFSSIKVLAKKKLNDYHLEEKIVQEVKYLNTLKASSPCLPRIVSIFQSAKLAYIAYEDVFVCDLALIISSESATMDAKKFYAACVLSSITALHDNGLMHRFINPSSFFVNERGVVKLTDLRYAKKMDGTKAFTIFGDPLYFAPEIVSQAGYDYSVDFWAFGIMLYEFFEGSSPFGNSETDETAIFKLLTSFKKGALKFTDKTPPLVGSMITNILDSEPSSRQGYKDSLELTSDPYFKGVNWKDLGFQGHITDVRIDSGVLIDESTIEDFPFPAFDEI